MPSFDCAATPEARVYVVDTSGGVSHSAFSDASEGDQHPKLFILISEESYFHLFVRFLLMESVNKSCPMAVFHSMTLNQSGSRFAGSGIRVKIA